MFYPAGLPQAKGIKTGAPHDAITLGEVVTDLFAEQSTVAAASSGNRAPARADPADYGESRSPIFVLAAEIQGSGRYVRTSVFCAAEDWALGVSQGPSSEFQFLGYAVSPLRASRSLCEPM